MFQPLWKTVWRFLKKLKIELPYDLAILGIYSKEMKTASETYMHIHEISQTEKDKCCMLSLICRIKKATLIKTESRMVVTRG